LEVPGVEPGLQVRDGQYQQRVIQYNNTEFSYRSSTESNLNGY